MTETFFQDVIAVSHGQAPQKPIRRKYNPESQNPETVPPPSIPFPPPAKPAQKLVKRLTYELTFQQINVNITEQNSLLLVAVTKMSGSELLLRWIRLTLL